MTTSQLDTSNANDRNPIFTSISTLDVLEIPEDLIYGNCS